MTTHLAPLALSAEPVLVREPLVFAQLLEGQGAPTELDGAIPGEAVLEETVIVELDANPAELVAMGDLGIEAAFAGLCAVLYATAIYLLLSRSIIRLLLGVVLLGNAVNTTLFTVGRLTREVPPVIPSGLDVPDAAVANPLPQALVLTAIVISFSFFAFLLVLAYRAYQALGTDDTDMMRAAEPVGEPMPPVGY